MTLVLFYPFSSPLKSLIYFIFILLKTGRGAGAGLSVFFSAGFGGGVSTFFGASADFASFLGASAYFGASAAGFAGPSAFFPSVSISKKGEPTSIVSPTLAKS